MEKPSSEPENPDQNRLHIRKAFGLLKNHAAAVANFTLQWQDLEDHLQSIQNSIQCTVFHLQNPNPNPNPVPKPPPSHFNGIPIRDGEKLLLHLKDRAKDHDSLRDGVRGALGAVEDPGGLVLAAIARFFPKKSRAAADSSELLAVRKSCVLLLEELANLKPEIGVGVREEAVKVAAAWKKKVTEGASPTPMEVQGFLMLLNSYGLVGEFDSDEIVSLFENVAQRKPCVELFRSLGFSGKAYDFIQNLISTKKNTEAIRFIYEFELVHKFAPTQLLEEHVKEAKKVTKTILKNPKSSLKEKDEATEKEQAALRGAIRCIEDYGLESEYPLESLRERIELLKKQRKERKKANAIPAKQNPQPRQLSGNKRPFPDSTHHPRAGPTVAMPMPIPNLYPRAPPGGSRQMLHHHHPPPSGGKRMEYLNTSSMMAIPQPPAAAAAESPNISARSAAGTHHQHHHRGGGGEPRQYMYSGESSHYQQQQQPLSAQYSPRYHSSIVFDRPTLDVGPVASPGLAREARNSNLTGYVPEAQRVSGSHYGLPGSDAEHIDLLVERYQIKERPGQFGSSSWAQTQTQAQEIRSNESPCSNSLAYYRDGAYRAVTSHGERPVSSNGNYDLLSNSSYGYRM